MRNLMGILTVRSGKRFVFRYVDGLWLLWGHDSDPTEGACHKHRTLPHGTVELFDVDDPPRTVSYLPVMGPFG